MKIHVSGGTSGSDSGGSRTSDERPGRHSETKIETKQTSVSYKETPTALELKIDMPGADAAGMDITLKGRRLTVRHERKAETRSKDDRSEKVETVREVRSKEIELPADVDPENVDAVFKNGVLQLKLQKLGVRQG